MKLTQLHLKSEISSAKNGLERGVREQCAGLKFKADIENMINEDDLAENFLAGLNEKYDCSDFDDFDLIEWARDIQGDFVNSFIEVSGLVEYIDNYFDGNQRRFAESEGVKPPQITQWVSKDFIVIDHVLHSPRRELNH